jgi:hypothetical protein
MTTAIFGLLLWPVGTFSILRSTIMPSITRPRERRAELKKNKAVIDQRHTENNVLIVKEITFGACDEELAAIGISSTVCLETNLLI